MEYVVERLSRGNQRQFALVTGLDPATVNRLVKGVYRLNERQIAAIVAVWPSLNPDFLRGLSEDTGLPDTPRDSLAHQLEMKDLEIEHLKDKVALLTWVLETIVNQSVSTLSTKDVDKIMRKIDEK